MSDWRTRVNLNRRDGFKAAGIILGLLFALIFAGWIVSRLMRGQVPPPPSGPVLPNVPTPGAKPTPRPAP